MKFDVLCPSFNYGRFIGEAAASVLHQDVDVRYVIQDAGSPDETRDVIRRFSDSRLDIVVEPDAGQSDALNKCLTRTNGDIVGWLNADEFYLPGSLSAVEDIFASRPDVDFVFGDVLFVDEKGALIRLLAQPGWSRFALEHRGCYVSTCATFFRRSLVGTKTFDTELRTVMDWDFYLDLTARANQIVHVPRPLAAFRAHDSRVTAEPLSRNSPEHQRVRDRYSISQSAALGHLGDLNHRIRKVTSGARTREGIAREFAGTSMSWQGETDAPCADVIRAVSPL